MTDVCYFLGGRHIDSRDFFSHGKTYHCDRAGTPMTGNHEYSVSKGKLLEGRYGKGD